MHEIDVTRDLYRGWRSSEHLIGLLGAQDQCRRGLLGAARCETAGRAPFAPRKEPGVLVAVVELNTDTNEWELAVLPRAHVLSRCDFEREQERMNVPHIDCRVHTSSIEQWPWADAFSTDLRA